MGNPLGPRQTRRRGLRWRLDNPDLRVKLARAGQWMVMERFTIHRMVREIEHLLQRVVTAGTPAAAHIA